MIWAVVSYKSYLYFILQGGERSLFFCVVFSFTGQIGSTAGVLVFLLSILGWLFLSCC